MKLIATFSLLVLLVSAALAQTASPSRQTPPPGIAIPQTDRAELIARTAALGQEIDGLRKQTRVRGLLADVEIFHKAVDWPLRYDEFFDLKQVAIAQALLEEGRKRATALREGKSPWAGATGLVVRGYVSKIDGSVQPYGLVVPTNWNPSDKTPRPLWCWLHGRNEKLTELAFIDERMKRPGEFTPEGAFVLHLYGRFCNANKFAGETDFFEALADVRARYPIDPDRIAVVGFSMGGAACWHIATHHAGLFAAASPGAGFAETAVYAKVFAPGKEPPPRWEQTLWRMYDATAYAGNLANCPLIAYSGEIDPQKQSADIMEKAMAEEGLKLERSIGPKTAHKYEPETKKALSRRLEELVTKGRETMPPRVRFTTYTLRYNEMEWLAIDALEKHWDRAQIDAELVDEGTFRVRTKNVAAFTISLRVNPPPLDKTQPPRVLVDDDELSGPPVTAGWTAHFRKAGGKWVSGSGERRVGLRKQHGLSGPIDDAFMDSFIFVRPSGHSANDRVAAWVDSELRRATTEWRTVFRGEARIKDDKALTEQDIADANLILWGDPSSNSVLAKILAKLPIEWTRESLSLGKIKVSAKDHVPLLIFPNPLNPAHYVVLNSSFTFREGSSQTNSQQTPKLPDWAIVDLRTPPNDKAPGLIVDADFFDEEWRVLAR